MAPADNDRAARNVDLVVRGQKTSDGAGVSLTRHIGHPRLLRLDPFLMLDEFRSDEPQDYLAGFPDHPHRGFETLTYMIAGRFRHKDNKGHEGLLLAGAAQWMTAGRGIVHSEMPEQEEGLVWGFQLWINLPAADKMMEASYRDLHAKDIPKVSLEGGGRGAVLAGSLLGATGPIAGRKTELFFVDLELAPSSSTSLEVPAGHEGFVYVMQGQGHVGPHTGDMDLGRGDLAVLKSGGTNLRLEAAGVGARMLVVMGKPLGEPVVQRGPFVMNTAQEIEQAFEDFRAGRF